MVKTVLLALLFSLQNGTDPDEFVCRSPKADFVIVEEKNDLIVASSIAFKITLLPRTIYESAKWVASRGLMSRLYPAQNLIQKLFTSKFQNKHLDEERARVAQQLKSEGYIVRHLTLEKNNVQYSALLIGHSTHIENKKWVLQATGNIKPIEQDAVKFARQYHKLDYNLLMVNGPCVGRSEGAATPKSIGDAQEVGLRFIEESLQANKIVIAGYSLGGAAIGMAIPDHKFNQENRNYLVIRQMTFDRASNIFKLYAKVKAPFLKPFIKRIVLWANCEMDSVAASKKLEELNIQESIIQAGNINSFSNDGVIPEKSTLGYRLLKEGIGGSTKHFIKIPEATHAIPFDPTLDSIRDWEKTLQ